MRYVYSIKQIDEKLPDAELYLFSNWNETERLGGFRRDLYVMTDSGFIESKYGSHRALEELFCEYNTNQRQRVNMMHNFAVSDVVVITYMNGGQEVVEEWFCDAVGFHKLT